MEEILLVDPEMIGVHACQLRADILLTITDGGLGGIACAHFIDVLGEFSLCGADVVFFQFDVASFFQSLIML